MSMVEFMNHQLDTIVQEAEHSYDPGDYAQCESCNAQDMRDCLECPIASHNHIATEKGNNLPDVVSL